MTRSTARALNTLPGFESNLKYRTCLCEPTLTETDNQLRKEMREKTFAMQGCAEKSAQELGP